jgi:hypothetical protein
MTETKTPQDVAALGFAYSGFIVSATMLHDFVNRGVITAEDTIRIISNAKRTLGNPEAFPADLRARQFAEMLLASVETMLGLASAQKPPAGPN